MKKALVISFFESNNLGDLELSKSIQDLVNERGYKQIQYDFPTALKINKEKREISNLQIKPDSLERGRNILRLIKKLAINTIGIINYEILYFIIQKNIILKQKWKILEKDIQQSDVVILAGGNMLMDIDPNWPIMFLAYKSLAIKYNKPVKIMYVGIGPFLHKGSISIYRKALRNIKEISVRDQLSKEMCRKLSNKMNIIESADPVFYKQIVKRDTRLSKIQEVLDNGKLKIGICVLGEICFSAKEIYNEYINGLCNLTEKISIISPTEFYLFSTESSDYESVRKLNEMLKGKNNMINVIHIKKVDEIYKLYLDLHYLIGGRMHSLIFAQICLLPHLGVVWQEKLIGYGKKVNSSSMFRVEDLSTKMDEIIDVIFKKSIDKEIIDNMYQVNNNLKQLVEIGNIL